MINPTIGVLTISCVTTFVLSLLYKVTTDQEKIRKLNEELKELNKKFKEAQKNNNQKELLKLQGKLLEVNNEKMRISMKTTLISFAVIIPIFMYVLPTLYGDVSVELNEDLSGVVKYGSYEANVKLLQENPVLMEIGDKKVGEKDVVLLGKDRFVFKAYDKNKKTLLLKRVVVTLPVPLPIWGYHIGWLGWYILVSIPMSVTFRKILGVVQ
ncbi:MAG TPA: DUF106 domain-containing protein [Candidatus Aenigmarchaeota archaeon]|nr:DUF106 domain-containing protein [Candidatus Aenigmarchaeota archaeon]